MIRFKLVLFCCAFALLIAACGQRGPLFLPDPEIKSEITEEPEADDDDDLGA